VFTVYGDGEHRGRLLPSLREAARLGSVLELTDGTQRRDFTYVEDVASGLLRIGVVSNVAGGAVNLATGTLTTVRDFVETGAMILRMEQEHLLFGSLPGRPEEMRHAPVTIERLKTITRWAPTTSIRDGILRTIRFASERHGIELRT
jgi:nucleoside-diphosphate-sugar epimerase